MDLIEINRRTDAALLENRRAELIIIGLSVGIFALGASTLLIGYFARNVYLMSGGTISSVFLYGPIKEIVRLRRDNIVLQVTPTLIAGLPKDQVIQEVKKLLIHIRGAKK